VGFYKNPNQAFSQPGDAWFLGHNVYGIGSGAFGV
jgi:hypothetical protein